VKELQNGIQHAPRERWAVRIFRLAEFERVAPGGLDAEAGWSDFFLFLRRGARYTPPMSIRKAGGDWEPMLLPIEPRYCTVCKQGLYRDKTMLRGGWSRYTVCDEFVHYSCLASGKFSFLKARPRVCKSCRAAQAPVSHQVDSAVAVSS
jgi:hypothetical protein